MEIYIVTEYNEKIILDFKEQNNTYSSLFSTIYYQLISSYNKIRINLSSNRTIDAFVIIEENDQFLSVVNDIQGWYLIISTSDSDNIRISDNIYVYKTENIDENYISVQMRNEMKNISLSNISVKSIKKPRSGFNYNKININNTGMWEKGSDINIKYEKEEYLLIFYENNLIYYNKN